jgi:hypothetical protein
MGWIREMIILRFIKTLKANSRLRKWKFKMKMSHMNSLYLILIEKNKIELKQAKVCR